MACLEPFEPLQPPGYAAVHRRSPTVAYRNSVGDHLSLSFSC
jgi:hypothetical protein